VEVKLDRTLVIIKPDGVQRNLIGEIILRLERRGLRVVAMKMMQITSDLAQRHYAVHRGKPFFDSLIQYITSGPVVALVVEGSQAIEVIRRTMGSTDPAQAAPGTIRGDLALDMRRNLIHGSDSPESAVYEIALFFSPEEIVPLTRDIDCWICPS
jgi:nucleoside-diphosphate kinase